MKREQVRHILDQYYKAETDLEQEALLRKEICHLDEFEEEKDIFSYYQQASIVPDNLEERIFKHIQIKEKSAKSFRLRTIEIISVAAVLVLFLSVLQVQHFNKQTRLTQEEKFSVLEQALTQVSNGIQPKESSEITYVFQDDDVEIVMN